MMNVVKRVTSNSLFVLLIKFFDILFNLVISIALAKYFGRAGFGKLSFLATFFFFLGSVDNQWIRPIVIRQVSRNQTDSRRIIGNALVIRALISVTAIVLFWLTILLVRPSGDVAFLALFTSIGLLFSSIISSYETILQARLKMGYCLWYSLLNKAMTLLLIYGVATYGGNLFHFYSLSLIPHFMLLLQVRYSSQKIIRPEFVIDLGLWRILFKESWPLALTAVFIFIYQRLDHIILFRLKGPEAAGLYSAAVKIAESLHILPMALAMSVLPLLSEYHRTSRDYFEKIYRLCFKYMLLFILPVACYVSFYSGRIILLFGKDFLPSATALRILVWAEVFVFLGIINNSILIAANKQKIDPLFTGVSAIINIVLNLVLIPRYNILGAAIASFISYSVGPFMGYFIPATSDYSRCMCYYSLKPSLASLLTMAIIYYGNFPLWLSVFSAPAIYLIAVYLIKGITREDIRIMKSALFA